MVKLSLPHPIPITNPTSPFRNFNFMRPIKIVGSDTDLHDYQVRIHLDRSNFPLEKCKPDGSDIRFRDDSGEILPYWIERWNAAEGVIWCKIPFIPAESSKFIWMIYGNPNAKSGSNGNAVFELFDVQGIVGFWHFDEPQWTGAVGEVKDETGVNNGRARYGATTTSDAKYGRAGYFDGSECYVDCGSNPILDPTDDISIEVWIKKQGDTAGDYQRIIYKYRDYELFVKNDGYLDLRILGTDDYKVAYSYLQDDIWYHIVGIIDVQGSSTYMELWVNGEMKDSDTYDVVPSTGNILFIGNRGGRDKPFYGVIDEPRIYNRILTPTEIEILYNNYMQKMGSYFNVRKYVTPAPVVIV